MDFDIVLHGKPNAGCQKATNGLDIGFCQCLVDEFFKKKDSIREPELMVVDAWYWRGTWYGVYTFWLSDRIFDMAGRGSFFGISFIVKGGYLCLVSEAYKMLKKAYREQVVGTYINGQGKFIVQDFSDGAAFNRLVSAISSQFANLVERFDDGFRQNRNNESPGRYSLLDCDSKAFVRDWKVCGRMLVAETFSSKDANSLKVDKLSGELQQLKKELAAKNERVSRLESEIKHLKSQIDSDELQQLKNELVAKDAKIRQLQAEIDGLRLQIRPTPRPQPTPVPQPRKSWINQIKTIHVALVCIVLLFFSLALNGVALYELKSQYTDVDCMLTLMQKKEVTIDEINQKESLTIRVRKPMSDYGFYITNIKGDAVTQTSDSMVELVIPKIEKENDNEPIVIIYGSEDPRKRNEKNIIEIP